MLLVLVIFLLSNRGPESLGFWPFGFLVSLPEGAVVIAALVIGFLGGLALHLPKRYSARRRARKAEKRIAELETRLAAGGLPAGGLAAGGLATGVPAVQPTLLQNPGVQPTILR